MQIVELIHAEKGAKKASCTKAIQAYCGLGIAAAKEVTDALLENKYPAVSLQPAAAARSFIVELAALGVVARFAEGPNYSPRERLASALSSVQAALTPEVLQTCQSLSAHGEWELALSHCLAHLQSGEESRSATELAALAELAIEFGVLQRSQG